MSERCAFYKPPVPSRSKINVLLNDVTVRFGAWPLNFQRRQKLTDSVEGSESEVVQCLAQSNQSVCIAVLVMYTYNETRANRKPANFGINSIFPNLVSHFAQIRPLSLPAWNQTRTSNN